MITYLKLGGILALVAGLFGGGFYLGGLRSEAALEAFQSAQSANTAKAVLAERASGAAELARVNLLLKGYQDAPIDPIDVGLAHRVYVYASAADCPVSGAGAHPAGAVSPSPQPSSDPGFVGLAQSVIDACAQDAAELTAIQQAWPRQ